MKSIGRAVVAKARPDLFCAYVGTAQIVDSQDSAAGHTQVLAKARALGDKSAVRRLEAAPPPYRDSDKFSTFEEIALTYEIRANPKAGEALWRPLAAPDYGLGDVWALVGSGRSSSMRHFFGVGMDGEFPTDDVRKRGLDFSTPIVIIQGANDDLTPASVTKSWFDTLKAPRKSFVSIPGAGHAALIEQPNVFVAALKQYASCAPT